MPIGYMGFATVGGEGLLATGSSLHRVIDPIISASSVGQGWRTAAKHHYADNIVKYEGDITCDLTMKPWDIFKNWFIEQRITSQSAVISPDGIRTWNFGKGSNGISTSGNLVGLWCSSFEFSTSENQAVTLSIGTVGFIMEERGGGANYTVNRTAISGAPNMCDKALNVGGNNENPVPYWKTNATLTVGSTTNGVVTEWSVGGNNNVQIVSGCNGTRTPHALLMGEVDVSGSVTLFNASGVAGLITGASDNDPPASSNHFDVTIAGKRIQCKSVLLNDDSYPIQGPNNPVVRTFGIMGLNCNDTAGAITML